MRVLLVIAVFVGAIFIIPLVLTDLARELSRNSYHPHDVNIWTSFKNSGFVLTR
jgi:hypothetical protein